MQTFLIHGDDIQKSYSRLNLFVNEAKKRSWEVVFLDESPLTINENIASTTLFGKDRFLVHRNFSKVSPKDLEWIKKHEGKYTGNLVFFSEKSVAKTSVNKLPKNTKIEEYKLPVLIWKFLDSFYPGNSRFILNLMHELLKTTSVEFIFGLLSRQIRDLYWVKKDPKSLDYPSWRIGKLKSQSSKFELSGLEDLIDKMAEADINSKTGKAKLNSLLDFLIIEQLE